jgi:DHA1 family tetracycline resistance protein-like MFS transporter
MKHKPSRLVIFLSVFIDLIGFGIVLPLLPGYAEEFGAKSFAIGAIIASFSLMQFLFAPVWGRWSDHIGRRPVMLIGNLGAAGSYALFAFASGMHGTTALWWILVSRVFAGIAGANISVASAYIADISPAEKRSAGMALIGIAFGLGFIFGPAVGAFSADIFGKTGPGWVAAGLCAANFILGWFILGESHQPGSAPAAPRPKFTQWGHTLRQPKLGLLINIFFLATFCFTCFESTFPLMLGLPEASHLGLKSRDQVGYLFAYAGIITVLVQGMIHRLVKSLGEPRLIFGSLVIFAAGLVALPFQTHLTGLLIALAVLAVGSGLNRAPVFGLISLKSPPHEQGANLGVAQSFGSLARIIGPVVATTLFYLRPAKPSPEAPYLISGGIAFLTALLAWLFLCRGAQTKSLAGTAVSAQK